MNNINNFTASRANPPFKGGRGDFFNKIIFYKKNKNLK